MEARGFGSGPRTSLRASKLHKRDWILIVTSAVAVIAFIAGRAADWYPYPTLHAPDVAIVPLAACLLLFAPVLTWRSRA
jgi:hypothetical protein